MSNRLCRAVAGGLLCACWSGDTKVLQIHPYADTAGVAAAPSNAALRRRASDLRLSLAAADTVLSVQVGDTLAVERFQDAAIVRGRLVLLDDRRNQLVTFDRQGRLLHRFVSAQDTRNSLRDLRMLGVRDSSLWLITGPDLAHEMRLDDRSVRSARSYELGTHPVDVCISYRGAVVHHIADGQPLLKLVSFGAAKPAAFGGQYAARNPIVQMTLGETRVACGGRLIVAARVLTGEVYGYDSTLSETFRYRIPAFLPLEVREYRNGGVENRPTAKGFHRVEGVHFLDAGTVLVQVGEYSTRIDTVTGLNGRDRVRSFLLDVASGSMEQVREQEAIVLAVDEGAIVEVNTRFPERLTWMKLRR